MRSIVLAVLAALALAACSAARPLDLSSARGFCNTGSIGDADDEGMACKEQIGICGRFFDPLAAGVKDEAECLARCKAADDSLFHVYAADPCREAVKLGRSYCEQYCRGNYP
ncbi:MAG: hypothetical protein AB1916_05860 [Thermodesulfobacteriota bacterium]